MGFSTSLTVNSLRAIVNVPKNSRAWRVANSIFMPAGPLHSEANILLLRSDMLTLDTTTTHTITWQQHGDKPITIAFAGWYLISAERLLPGAEDDPNALYLCKFVDKRYLAAKNSSSGTVISNVRSYANNQDYLDGTTTIGTWQQLVTTLFNACGLSGSATLPVGLSIDGAPDTTFFIENHGYRALNAVLDQLDCCLVPNGFSGGVAIAQLGGAQVIPAKPTWLEWNTQPIFPKSTSAATLDICFHNHYTSFGQERDTELTNNWSLNGAGYVVSLATGITGAVGTKVLWDDLHRVLDEDNVTENGADLVTRQNNRKSRYITRRTVTTEHKIYIGLHSDYVPGGSIRGVLWRNWDDGQGTVTEYVCGPDLILRQPNVRDTGIDWSTAFESLETETYSPPDLSRRTYPSYPRIINVVQVHAVAASPDPDPTAGDTVSPNADGFHRGKVRRWVANAMATLDDCWVRFIDSHDTLEGQVDAIQDEFYGPARLSGVSTSTNADGDPELLPVYLVKKGEAPEVGVPFKYTDSPHSCPAYGVMEVYGETTIDSVVHLLTRRPTTTFRRRYLVNGSTEKATDETGRGKWLEKSDRVLIDSGVSTGSLATQIEMGVESGKFGLVLYRPGFQYFYYEVIDTANIATCIQREVTELIGKLTGSSLAKNTSGSVDVWMGVAGSEAVTTFQISCRNQLDTLLAADWLDLQFRNGNWYCSRRTITQTYMGKTSSAIAKNAQGTVRRYDSVTTSGETDSGVDYTCINKFANVGSDKWVTFTRIDNLYYLIAAEC